MVENDFNFDPEIIQDFSLHQNIDNETRISAGVGPTNISGGVPAKGMGGTITITGGMGATGRKMLSQPSSMPYVMAASSKPGVAIKEFSSYIGSFESGELVHQYVLSTIKLLAFTLSLSLDFECLYDGLLEKEYIFQIEGLTPQVLQFQQSWKTFLAQVQDKESING